MAALFERCFYSPFHRLRDRVARLVDDELRDRAERWQSALDHFEERLSQLESLIPEPPNAFSNKSLKSEFPSPAVSVIIPTWNRAGVVAEAISSVQAQCFQDWELLVVDDGSADSTADVLARFSDDPRILYIRRDHAGKCAARNHALQLAKGKLIAYLDSDNLWYPDFLVMAVSAFAADPDLACAYGAMVTDFHRPKRRILFEPFDRNRLLQGNYIGMSTFVHRRDLFECHGGFDEKLNSQEDWDLILRYTQDKPAFRLPVLAVRYRVVDNIRVTDPKIRGEDLLYIKGKWA